MRTVQKPKKLKRVVRQKMNCFIVIKPLTLVRPSLRNALSDA